MQTAQHFLDKMKAAAESESFALAACTTVVCEVIEHMANVGSIDEERPVWFELIRVFRSCEPF